MQFDLRIPLGLMFGTFGLILTGVGLFGSHELRERSLGINMNLWWGLVLLAFSAFMLVFAFRRKREGGESGAAERKSPELLRKDS